MSTARGNAERAKFGYLLELSARSRFRRWSVTIYSPFDRILAAKRTIIESLHDARGVLAGDPTLSSGW